jgi:hypothetical protein
VPFNEGRALMRSERFADAVQKFERSLSIRITGDALLSLADCLVKVDRYASAAATFDRARAFLEQARDDRAALARSRAEALRPHIPTITPVARGVPGATAWIDGVPAAIGVPYPIDGGEHVVAIHAPCRRPFETQVTVWVHDATNPVDGYLPLSDEPSCRKASRSPNSTTWNSRNITAAVLGSAGLLALGVSGFFGLRAVGTKHDLEALCTDYPRGCPAARESEVNGLVSDGERQATIATVASVVGFVALAGALVVVLSAPAARSAAPRTVPASAGIRF